MGFLNSYMAARKGTKAYRFQVMAMQMRKNGKYEESEAKLDEAMSLYEEAYALGFRKPNMLQGYAVLLMRRYQYERAREIMLEVNKNKGLTADDRFAVRMDYSICQWKMGLLDKAIETARLAGEHKKNGTVYSTLGMYLVEKAAQTGDFAEAEAFLQEAMEYDDEDSATLDNMGQMRYAQAKLERDAAKKAQLRAEAYQYLNKALEIRPEQVATNYVLAEMYCEDGDTEKARNHVETAMKVPISGLLQVSQAQLEELRRKIS